MDEHWLSSIDAVQIMIEEDPDYKLPLSYVLHLGGNVFSKLKRSIESSEKLLESSRFSDENTRRSAKRKLEHAEFGLKRAHRFQADLEQEIALAREPGDSILKIRNKSPEGTQGVQVSRTSLVEWAYRSQKVDIDGFYARRSGGQRPLEPRYTEEISTREIDLKTRGWIADPDTMLQQVMTHSKKEQLFFANLYLLQVFLTIHRKNWKSEVERLGITTAHDLLDKGVVIKSDIAKAISTEAGGSERTYEKFLDPLLTCCLNSNAKRVVFSDREFPTANRILFGLTLSILVERHLKPSVDIVKRIQANHRIAFKLLVKNSPIAIDKTTRKHLWPSFVNAWNPKNRKPKNASA